jgi:multiple antibiotic resistance protein
MSKFWLCFVPLFVAVDAIGILPMFLNLTHGLNQKKKRDVIIQSMITALAVALAFMAIGKGVLRFLNITVPDFMIAGGLLLFFISITDMLNAGAKQRVLDADSLGAVPIGVPLIVGPAVLTTTILLESQYGALPTVLATLVNVLLAGIFFYFSKNIDRVLGKAGAKTLSKLASLLLAAIGVMITRKGLMTFIK